ncbi:hypothetical protein AgCh_032347 [Apium graveolens]
MPTYLCELENQAKKRSSDLWAKSPTKQVYLRIYKDASTLQYLTQIKQRTPLVPVRLTVDLGGRFLWTVCERGYNSTTIRSAGCDTTQCHLADASNDCYICAGAPPGPGCTVADTCWRAPQNSVTRKTEVGEGEEQVIRGEYSAQYFIGVESININSKTVKLNTTLLQINKQGSGGTKISTVNPYTVLETSIYHAVIKTFVNELKNVTRVPPVAPFGACFSSKNIRNTRVGPAVPNIDLVMKENGVVWRMFGENTMVRVNKDVSCLGFVNGGEEPTYLASIVIGGHQLEENLLTFDLERSRLGFSSSLLSQKTTCSNYKIVFNV